VEGTRERGKRASPVTPDVSNKKGWTGGETLSTTRTISSPASVVG